MRNFSAASSCTFKFSSTAVEDASAGARESAGRRHRTCKHSGDRPASFAQYSAVVCPRLSGFKTDFGGSGSDLAHKLDTSQITSWLNSGPYMVLKLRVTLPCGRAASFNILGHVSAVTT